MYCIHCGIDLGPSAKFCSSCGNSLPDTTKAVSGRKPDWEFHVSVLGWLIIAHAALTGMIGIIVMFGGAFLRRLITEHPNLLDNADPKSVPPPDVVISVIGPITFLIGVIFMAIALPSIAAGVGLLRHRSWGRALALVLSFVRLLEFPFGTATAIYSFWVLLSQGGKRSYTERATQAEA